MSIHFFSFKHKIGSKCFSGQQKVHWYLLYYQPHQPEAGNTNWTFLGHWCIVPSPQSILINHGCDSTSIVLSWFDVDWMVFLLIGYWDLLLHIEILLVSWDEWIRDLIWLCSSRLLHILLLTPYGQNSMQLSRVSCIGALRKRAQIPQCRRWIVVARVSKNVNLEGIKVFSMLPWTNDAHFWSSLVALSSGSPKRACPRASCVLDVCRLPN